MNVRLLLAALGAALPCAIAAAPAAGIVPAPVTIHPEAVALGSVEPLKLELARPAKADGPPRRIENVFPPAGQVPSGDRVDMGWPAPGGPVIRVVDDGAPRAAAALLPGIDRRFEGPYDGGVTPPDPNMTVGRDHALVIINLLFGMYDRSGTLVAGPYSLASFFGLAPGFSPYDPLVIYDPYADRYIAATASDNRSQSRIYVAFSQTGDPTGAWNRYFINASAGQTSNWADYPSVGLDRFAVYFTANMFGWTTGFRNVTVFIYSKEDGYAGRPLRSTHLIDVRTATNGSPFRLRPAYVPQVTPGDEYFLAHADQTFGNVINLFRLGGNRFDAPTIAASTVALPGTYFPPGKGRQPGTGGGVDSLGANLWNVYYRNGTLWTAQSISGTQGNAAWVHELDVSTPTATRVRTWELEATGYDTYFPYVVPDPLDDDFTLLSAFSSGTQYVTGRYWNVAADGTVRSAELTALNSAYRNNMDRHGDYFSIVTDPRDRNRLWMVAQYEKVAGSTGNSGVASVRFEDVPVPVAPPPVPDGHDVPGRQVKVAKATGGNVKVTWDATTCPPPGTHLVWFDLGAMAHYAVAAETCATGTGGTWTGAPPAGNVAVLVVPDDGARTEGAHGADSTGRERPSSSTRCGLVQKLPYGTCGP